MATGSFQDDIGLKVSLPKKDVNTAADQDLIFSSSWPNIPIYKAVHIKNTVFASAGATPLYDHSLGFVPLIFYYEPATGSTGIIQTRSTILTDKKYIYSYPNMFGGSVELVNVDIYVIITTIDIETQLNTPTIKTASTKDLSVVSDYGFKVVKKGKSITSTVMSDYIIHSAARSPMVHSVNPGQLTSVFSNTVAFQASHDLPYNPMFVVMASYDSFQIPGNLNFVGRAYQSMSGFAAVRTSGNFVQIPGNGDTGYASIIFLKDPFEFSDVQQVTI